MNKLFNVLTNGEMAQVLGGKETKIIMKPDGTVITITTEIKDDGTVVVSRQEP